MVAAVPVRYVFRCDMDRDWSFAISFAQEKPTTIFRKTKDFIIRGTWGGPFDIMHITNIVRLSWTLWMSSDPLTCIISQFPTIATLLCTLQLRRLFIWWVWQSIFDDILRKQEKIRVLSGESHVEYLMTYCVLRKGMCKAKGDCGECYSRSPWCSTVPCPNANQLKNETEIM